MRHHIGVVSCSLAVGACGQTRFPFPGPPDKPKLSPEQQKAIMDSNPLFQPATWVDESQLLITLLQFICLVLVLFPVAMALWAWSKGRRYRREFQTISTDMQMSEVSSLTRSVSDESCPSKGTTLSCVNLSLWIDVPRRTVKGRDAWLSRLVDPAVQKYRQFTGAGFSELQVLDDITAHFEPGTLTAIMGPSGSGKTTLLNMLGGQCRKGRFCGARMLNGRRYTNREFLAIMRTQGYVQQTDTFFADLTVLETLAFSAKLQLSGNNEIQISRVESVLQEVGLMSAANTRIGGNRNRTGLSGGQRRRLSIAIELLRLPSVLLLDEPTSGLDSTSSLKIVRLMHSLAHDKNRTVITSIHQPRSEIFDLFDQILLLTEGGRLAHLGPANGCVDFLSSCPGIVLDPSQLTNPGDYIIDALGLNAEDVSEAGSNRTMLGEFYRSSNLYNAVQARTEEFSREINPPQFIVPRTPSIITQVWVLAYRRMSQLTMDGSSVVALYLQIIAVGGVIGIAFSFPNDDDKLAMPYQDTMTLFCLSSYGMILQYILLVPEYLEHERALLYKERENGSCTNQSYVLSCVLSEIPRATIHGLLLLALGYTFIPLNPGSDFVVFAIAVLVVGLISWQGVVGFASLLSDEISFVYGLLFLILGLGCLFGGMVVTKSNIPWYFMWVFYSSVPAITNRAMIINDMQCCHLSITCEEWSDAMMKFRLTDDTNLMPQHGAPLHLPSGMPPAFQRIVQQWQQHAQHPPHRGMPCPPVLQIQSQNLTEYQGNLGRLALFAMDMQYPSKWESLLTLVCVAVVSRFASFAILGLRDWRSQSLKEITQHPRNGKGSEKYSELSEVT
jgi:ABC-type multidrug transport system ATPase subunit